MRDATLASAHVLWETGQLASADTARFHTRSGLLTATRHGQWIELDFPATPDQAADAPPSLAEALGVQPLYVGQSRFDYLFELRRTRFVACVRTSAGSAQWPHEA